MSVWVLGVCLLALFGLSRENASPVSQRSQLVCVAKMFRHRNMEFSAKVFYAEDNAKAHTPRPRSLLERFHHLMVPVHTYPASDFQFIAIRNRYHSIRAASRVLSLYCVFLV